MSRRDTVDGGMRSVRIDTHLHTTASYDGETAPAELVRAARRVGLDGIVVTDHDTVRGAERVVDLASDADLVVIVGCEVSTADGHLLAIGVDAAPEPGRPLTVTAREVRSDGGLAVVPHPFQRSRHGVRASDIVDVDGVEVYNAQTLVGLRNRQAERFADRYGYPSFGGSDAHRAVTVGRAVTEVRVPEIAPLTPETVVESMRAGRTEPVGHRTSAWQYLTKLAGTAKYRTTTLL